jgi:hypothetical protein
MKDALKSIPTHHFVSWVVYVGGLALIMTSSLSIGICISQLHVVKMLVYVYTLLFGAIICILEGHFCNNSGIIYIRELILDGLPFLRYLWGRGLIYILCGSLQMTHLSPMNLWSGLWLIGVGILFLIIGIQTKRRLSNLKKSLGDTTLLRKAFERFDRDGDGVLCENEFGNLVANLTAEDLDEDELEGTFSSVDVAGKGYVTLNEFITWFQGYEATTNLDDLPQFHPDDEVV